MAFGYISRKPRRGLPPRSLGSLLLVLVRLRFRRAFAALRELFRRVSTLRPVLLHIDDLQWGDADSILLLEYLLAPPSPPPILLVACFRSEEISSNLFLATLLDADHAKRARQVRVDPLSPAETARLARRLLDTESRSQHVDAIVRESAGNPFLVEELVRRSEEHTSELQSR